MSQARIPNPRIRSSDKVRRPRGRAGYLSGPDRVAPWNLAKQKLHSQAGKPAGSRDYCEHPRCCWWGDGSSALSRPRLPAGAANRVIGNGIGVARRRRECPAASHRILRRYCVACASARPSRWLAIRRPWLAHRALLIVRSSSRYENAAEAGRAQYARLEFPTFPSVRPQVNRRSRPTACCGVRPRIVLDLRIRKPSALAPDSHGAGLYHRSAFRL